MRGVNATSRDTAVPTVIHGGHRINVIPSEVTLEIDGRILPGTEPEEWRRRVQGVVGDNVDVELLSRNEGIEAEPASPLFDAIDATISAMDPKAVVAPYLSAVARTPGTCRALWSTASFRTVPPSRRQDILSWCMVMTSVSAWKI